MIIAIGSERKPKIEAVRNALAQIARLGHSAWETPEFICRNVPVDAPATPISDEQLMRGAQSRVDALIRVLAEASRTADYYVGLEGGLHHEMVDDRRRVFLRGWVYVSNGHEGYFGSGPSIELPTVIANGVLDDGEDLGVVIDRVAGKYDVRSNEGTWGILTANLLPRSHSFETALLAAFAPFYNPIFYR